MYIVEFRSILYWILVYLMRFLIMKSLKVCNHYKKDLNNSYSHIYDDCKFLTRIVYVRSCHILPTHSFNCLSL